MLEQSTNVIPQSILRMALVTMRNFQVSRLPLRLYRRDRGNDSAA